ncbi:Leucine-rich repeat transmembrane protein kinase family protein [Perilla frutescens var. frutescens]|nr:Leucine-rich repeat transmembrane protein kinase family protein [Perilla frutescens var. frutescens]
MASKHLSLLLLLVLSAYNSCQSNPADTQSYFFHLMNKLVVGNSLSNWDASKGKSYCNYTGVACGDDQESIVEIDISSWSLSGKFPAEACSYLPQLRVLRIGDNSFDGEFPRGIINCSFLEELNMSSAHLSGRLPDFSPLKSLRVLDLSRNEFSGDFPLSITNLTNLEVLNFNENPGFNSWLLPESVTRLTKVKSLVVSTCMLFGELPAFVGNMTSLIDLELSGNFLAGRVPKELGQLRNLQHLELYYNEFQGEIPEEIGNLTRLIDLDMSVNKLSGRIPASICRLPSLRVFQLYNNSLAGEIPTEIANSTTLKTLSLYENLLTGEVPPDLGRSSTMVALDLAENQLSGRLPEGLCSGGRLNYLLVLQNKFSGEVPKSYAECKSIVRFRISSNNLEGEIPQGIFSLPLASIIDVGYNNFIGSISTTIGNARNLSQLFMQGNRISGVIPAEISSATNLVKIDLSNNLLSGPIPPEIGSLRRLNLLMLQVNNLNSSIPESLSLLKSLNALDLSNNCLTGEIPESISKLLPNSLNFSNNHLSGRVPFPFVKGGMLESFSGNPDLCLPADLHSTSPNFHICSQSYTRKRINCVWVVGLLMGILIVGTVVFVKKWYSKEREVVETEDNLMSSSCFSYDMKNFHRLSFDQREIMDAMVDKNIVGYGGSGTVYKIELNSGEVVAVKKLWSRKAKDSDSSEEQVILDKEVKTEVETLGSIRHKNIVKLYSYILSFDCCLLVYEYMSNGNLWDALHRGEVMLDWPTRHQIALGVAQGLAYLHHHLMPPIIHRDIKSTNILLDVSYQAKLADFGIAKVLQARGSKESTSTAVIAGTYGYLAPEYAYSSRATTKCDVYSFGVVLMELITGKKPVEAEFGENMNIIYWVATKAETTEGVAEVVDERVSGLYKDDMIKVLSIALRCTCGAPLLRPTMNEVVQLLIEADPCKFNCCNFSTDSTKPKHQFHL